MRRHFRVSSVDVADVLSSRRSSPGAGLAFDHVVPPQQLSLQRAELHEIVALPAESVEHKGEARSRGLIRVNNKRGWSGYEGPFILRPDGDSMEATAGLSTAQRERPVGVCPRCHAVVRAFGQIGKKCAKPLPFGAKCPSVIRSALEADEWTECPDCGATGRIDASVCPRCEGEGWLYDNRRLRA